MGWILPCLLWVTLTSSAYSYRQFSYPDYPYYSGAQTRRIDHDTTRTYVEGNPEQYSERTDTQRPAQRMNERSIAVTSGIQRVQEKEKIRLQPWINESGHRSENGTNKIVNSPMKYPSISTRRGSIEEKPSDSVVFPGRTSAEKFKPEIPAECQDIGICETIPNYPQDLVDSIISKLGNKLDRFQVDRLPEPEIAQRIGPDNAEIDLCNNREMIMAPQAAKNKDGNWYVILNKRDSPIQGYRVEICQSKGQSCAENIAYFYRGYTGTCKQKYVERRMAAVDVDKEEVLYDMPFRLPSCCSCIAIHTGGN